MFVCFCFLVVLYFIDDYCAIFGVAAIHAFHTVVTAFGRVQLAHVAFAAVYTVALIENTFFHVSVSFSSDAWGAGRETSWAAFRLRASLMAA